MRVIGSIVDSYFPLLAAEARANAVGREIAAETGYDPSKPPKERGFADRACSAFVWVLDHQAASCAILAAAIVGIMVVGQLANPQEASALPIIPIIVGAGVIGAFFAGGDILEAAASTIQEGLRGAVNFELATITASIDSFTKSNMLTQDLNDVIPGVVDVLHNIHDTVTITVANVVLLVFLLVGLGKVISNMNKAETGIDLWQLCMVFIGFAFAKTIVDGSWALMQLAFDIVRFLIVSIANSPATQMAYAANAVPDSVENWGVLLMMLLVAFIVKCVVLFVIVLANITVIVRCIQIYVYICLAPLPLATLVSDGGRSVATHFIKAFSAVLMAGAILSLLFVMMGVFISTLSATTVVPSSIDSAIQWVIELFFSIGVFIAFGWCVFQSGTWARDFTGA